MEEFIPPHSIEAEICALGSMMLSQKAVEQVLEALESEDFYRPSHQTVFLAIRQLALQNKAIDLVTVKNELDARGQLSSVGGVDALIQIAESVPSPANAVDYAQIVADKATLRRLASAGHEITRVSHDGDKSVDEKVDSAEQLVFSVAGRRQREGFKHIRNVARTFFTKIDQLYESGEPIRGTPCGFHDLDRVTGGMYGGEMTIVAARPAMGKTSFILSFALHVAQQGLPVAVFSLEMSAEQLVRRMLSMLSGVGMGILKDPGLTENQYQRLADACETLYSLPIYIDDHSELSPFELRGKCRRLKAENENKLGLVMVDYLQLMKGNKRTENRVQEISEIARGLKGLSKDLDVPVLALSQLNRSVESREDKRPMLADIRESGSIEAEADLVMFIYRGEYYRRKEEGEDNEPFDPDKVEEAEIIIAKHRNGPTGKVMLGFQPNYARFRNLRL